LTTPIRAPRLRRRGPHQGGPTARPSAPASSRRGAGPGQLLDP